MNIIQKIRAMLTKTTVTKVTISMEIEVIEDDFNYPNRWSEWTNVYLKQGRWLSKKFFIGTKVLLDKSRVHCSMEDDTTNEVGAVNVLIEDMSTMENERGLAGLTIAKAMIRQQDIIPEELKKYRLIFLGSKGSFFFGLSLGCQCRPYMWFDGEKWQQGVTAYFKYCPEDRPGDYLVRTVM